MKKRNNYLWCFTLVNKYTLVTTPYFIVMAPDRARAEKVIHHYLDKNLYEVSFCMNVTHRNFCCVTNLMYPDVQPYEKSC